MNNFYTNVIAPDTTKTFSHYNITPDPSYAGSISSVGLADEFYNTDKGASYIAAFGTASATDFKNGDIGGVAFETAFLTNSSATAGLETRRLAEAFFELSGIVEIGQAEGDGAPVVSSVEFSRAPTAILLSFANYVASNTDLVAGGLYSEDNVTSYNIGFNQLTTTLLNQGYYVPQPASFEWNSETNQVTTTPVTISWDNVAALATANSGIVIGGTDPGATLQRINAAFADSSLKAGGLVHIPVAVQSAGSLNLIPASETYVLDPSTNTVYTVGASLDKHDGGALVIDTVIPGTTGYPLFDSGTYSSVSYGASTVSVGLQEANGLPLGTLSLNTATGNDTFTAVNGLVIALPHVSAIHITAQAGPQPAQMLIGDLTELGYSTNISTLTSLDSAYQNPTGTFYSVTGQVTGFAPESGGKTYAVVGYTPGAPGASMIGQNSAMYNGTTYDAYNYIYVPAGGTSDLTNDTWSNMQALTLTSSTAEMTGAQFAGFGNLTGNGQIVFTTAGSYSLAGDAADNGLFSLTAQSWGGTTLTGDATNYQTLTASLYGNDTLNAGSGTDDVLVAGEGVDTITAGSGGDIIYALNGLAAGSRVTGNLATPDAFVASGDISGASIVNQRYITLGNGTATSVGMTAAQLAGFTGGIYLGAATLTGDDTASATGYVSTLIASGNGNDTLTTGGDAGDSLSAANDNAAMLLRPAANDDCALRITLLKVV